MVMEQDTAHDFRIANIADTALRVHTECYLGRPYHTFFNWLPRKPHRSIAHDLQSLGIKKFISFELLLRDS